MPFSIFAVEYSMKKEQDFHLRWVNIGLASQHPRNTLKTSFNTWLYCENWLCHKLLLASFRFFPTINYFLCFTLTLYVVSTSLMFWQTITGWSWILGRSWTVAVWFLPLSITTCPVFVFLYVYSNQATCHLLPRWFVLGYNFESKI